MLLFSCVNNRVAVNVNDIIDADSILYIKCPTNSVIESTYYYSKNRDSIFIKDRMYIKEIVNTLREHTYKSVVKHPVICNHIVFYVNGKKYVFGLWQKGVSYNGEYKCDIDIINFMDKHLQNERNKGDEPVNLISDEVVGVDSVYKLCIQKMACLIKNPSEKQFFELENEFVYADDYSESLLYNIVAANKLGIDVAKIRVANCLTHSLNIPNIGKNSKEIALFYLKKWESSTKHKRGKQIIERFESSSKDDIEMIVPVITYKSSENQRLKACSLKGSIEDYKKLKEKLYNDKMYVFLLYYSYIMADRYGYLPAKKDVVTIIKRFYKEYHLEPIDKDTQYFCNFFK